MPSDTPAAQRGPGYREFIALMAVMISITAMSIDIVLPALPDIGRDLHAKHPNDPQLVVSILLLGMGFGQILLGPLSDCFGRKPIIFIGFVIFALGCLLSIFSTQFEAMLAGRVLQGVGVGGSRTAIAALIRDQYGGRAMARMMSAVMAVFIVVPAIAPALGQAILLITGWRAVFGVLMAQGLFALIWFVIRQPETLPAEHRLPVSVKRVAIAAMEVCTNRLALGYTLASGLIFGALLAYLNCAQQIFQEVYGLGWRFPFYTALLALAVGGASFLNSRIVMRFGMRMLSYRAISICMIAMALFLAATFQMGGRSPLWLMMICFAMAFFSLGILFGNLNAIAMEPLGHIAGVGAAVIGSLTNFISVPLAITIGRFYNGTTLPLTFGFAILSILTVVAMRWADTAPQDVTAGDTAGSTKC